MPLTTAYIAIGSNVGDRMAQMRAALRLLEASGEILVLQAGRIYENRAVGMGEADPFLNTVVEVKTGLSADDLLTRCLETEDALGRVRTGVWAPRTIDLDLLIFGETQIETERLHLPHPRLHERDFVVFPLRDIVPKLKVFGRPISEIADGLSSDELRCLPESLWTQPQVRAIAAIAENRVIGMGGSLPWSIPEDWELFLKKTKGGNLIMGRQSFLEMVKEPTWQEQRAYFVLTSHPEAIESYGAQVFTTVDAALAAATAGPRPVWICGGASIYEETLNAVDQLHITQVSGGFEGDTFFPKWSETFTKRIASVASGDAKHSYTFEVYERYFN